MGEFNIRWLKLSLLKYKNYLVNIQIKSCVLGKMKNSKKNKACIIYKWLNLPDVFYEIQALYYSQSLFLNIESHFLAINPLHAL